MPSLGAYCSATPGVVAQQPRRRSRRAPSVGNVAGFGKPPVIESTPGGRPARIAASSASPPRARCAKRVRPTVSHRLEGELRLLPAVERARRASAQFVSSCSERAGAHAARIAPLGAADRLAGLERGLDRARRARSRRRRRRRTRCRRARRRGRRSAPARRSGARETVVPERGDRAAREHRQPERAQAARRRGRSRRSRCPRARAACASVANSSPSTATRAAAGGDHQHVAGRAPRRAR